ncbi:MAG: phosphate/phosphite/phosphonate ABC transporter substrate-binding protein [Bdellovibrionales bacterium]|nr:phosphate/phosphite/phosphonate ABC transporter substrate-binding protein [Bdellovibrionales bacterium]
MLKSTSQLFSSLLVGVAALFFTAQAATSEEGIPKSITIGFSPGEDPEALKVKSEELVRKIQNKVGVPIKSFFSKDYQGLIDSMKKKEVDFAFYTAMSFVFAEKQAGAKVLFKKVWEHPYYYSAIMVLRDSKIKTLQDLKGKRFAFVDEKSASGFLYPSVRLKHLKLDPKTFFSSLKFTGNHAESVKLLLNKEVDGVAVFANDEKGTTSAVLSYAPERNNSVKALWVSDPIPNDPFCVRQDFHDQYPRFVFKMMDALLDLNEENMKDQEMQKLFGFKKLDTATSRQYQPVRDMVQTMSLKLN